MDARRKRKGRKSVTPELFRTFAKEIRFRIFGKYADAVSGKKSVKIKP